jgi:hypothetical protein
VEGSGLGQSKLHGFSICLKGLRKTTRAPTTELLAGIWTQALQNSKHQWLLRYDIQCPRFKSRLVHPWFLLSTSVFRKTLIAQQCLIQNVPGGKVNVLGGHSIGHSKQEGIHVHVSYAEQSRDRAVSLYRCKIVDKKEILRTVSNTGIYYSSDKVGTVYLV